MTQKSIFLTGATGYLGSRLIPELIKNGYSLKLLVRGKKKDSPSDRVVQTLSNICRDSAEVKECLNRIDILEGDITQRNLGLSNGSLKKVSNEISDFFHCAAAISFDEEKENFLKRNNIDGTKNILSFMNKLNNVHLHYMSTAYVCGQRKEVVKENELNVGQKFNNSYESIKSKAEGLVRRYLDKDKFKITIYRPSVVVGDSKTGQNNSNYGPYGILRIVDLSMRKLKQEYRRGNPALRTADIKIEDGKFIIPMRVIGKNNKRLNLITIDYALEAIIRIFLSRNNINKTYHITHPSPPSVCLLKDCLSEVLGVRGIEFVQPEVFKKAAIKPWERIFNNNIKIYTPYLLVDEPRFSNANTQKVLENAPIKQVEFDRSLILKLLAYSYSTNYGKNRRQ